MNVQVDTNILTRLSQFSHAHHAPARRSVMRLLPDGHSLNILPQNLYEFWAVATRNVAQNGLGLTIDEANAELQRVKQTFNLIEDPPQLAAEWERLVVRHQCRGAVSHDARIVAAMNLLNIQTLLTFNKADFTRYTGITVIDPTAATG